MWSLDYPVLKSMISSLGSLMFLPLLIISHRHIMLSCLSSHPLTSPTNPFDWMITTHILPHRTFLLILSIPLAIVFAIFNYFLNLNFPEEGSWNINSLSLCPDVAILNVSSTWILVMNTSWLWLPSSHLLSDFAGRLGAADGGDVASQHMEPDSILTSSTVCEEFACSPCEFPPEAPVSFYTPKIYRW